MLGSIHHLLHVCECEWAPVKRQLSSGREWDIERTRQV